MTARVNIHATGLTLGPAGVIIRGPSGSGKSLLALALLDDWQRRGLAASLIADDRLDLETTERGLVMHAPVTIAGLIELRGRGVVKRPFVPQAEIHLVVDLVDVLDRMPPEAAFGTELCGVALTRCPVPASDVIGLGHQILLVREAVEGLMPQTAAAGQKST